MKRTSRDSILDQTNSKSEVRYYQQRGGYQQQGGGRNPYHGRGGHAGHDPSLPDDCVFRDSFYKDGYLRREIFLQAAEKLAKKFENANPKMSQTSIRSFFNMLKQLDLRWRTDNSVTLAEIQEQYYMFVRHCVYQESRGIIPGIFRAFAEKHLDVATRSEDEFHGFVEYLTSIMARMKTKK